MLVADILAADVQQINEFRAQIEGYAARLAATRMTPAQIQELQRIHSALDKAMADMDTDTFVAQDRLFQLDSLTFREQSRNIGTLHSHHRPIVSMR